MAQPSRFWRSWAIAAKEKVSGVGDVAITLRYSAIGVALALAAMAFSYLTHYFMTAFEGGKIKKYSYPFVSDGPLSGRMKLLNNIFHVLAFLCALASLALFLLGMFAALDNLGGMYLGKDNDKALQLFLRGTRIRW